VLRERRDAVPRLVGDGHEAPALPEEKGDERASESVDAHVTRHPAAFAAGWYTPRRQFCQSWSFHSSPSWVGKMSGLRDKRRLRFLERHLGLKVTGVEGLLKQAVHLLGFGSGHRSFHSRARA
jgi:hypothetical protein